MDREDTITTLERGAWIDCAKRPGLASSEKGRPTTQGRTYTLLRHVKIVTVQVLILLLVLMLYI